MYQTGTHISSNSYVIDPTQEMLNDSTDVTIARETLEEMILQLSEEKKLILSDEQVSIPSLYYSELKSVQNLYRIKTNTTKLKEIEQSDLQMHIGEIESYNKVNYAASQKKHLKQQ